MITSYYIMNIKYSALDFSDNSQFRTSFQLQLIPFWIQLANNYPANFVLKLYYK